MNRCTFRMVSKAIRCALACLGATLAVAASTAPNIPATNKPNIIFILADDLGYGDLGCYGQKQIQTPSLDHMAAEGLRFTDAYAGATVCAPSRCVLMTGLHIGHARIRGLRPPYLPGAAMEASDISVAKLLKEAGYATGVIGKWGLGEPKTNVDGLPSRQGFDFFYGFLTHGHAHNHYPDYLWRNQTQEKLPNVVSKNPVFKGNVSEKKVQYAHDLLADESLTFVREHKDVPFFLYLCFTIPHANNEAGADGMEVPDFGDYANKDWPKPEKGKAAMISRMDADVGRLLELLKELQIDDNTLVVFSSDNGPPSDEGGRQPEFNDSNGPLRGYKGQMYEGGIRVPFIARWPNRIHAGTTSSSPITFADIMPTLANLGGGRPPTEIDGFDFSPTLFGKIQPELASRFLYSEFGKFGVYSQSARWNQWKAVRDPNTKNLELFDLAKDMGESHNVAAEHPDIVAKFNEYFASARSDSSDWPMTMSAEQQAAVSGKSTKQRN
jgi:arylsulfatase A-like enzyme